MIARSQIASSFCMVPSMLNDPSVTINGWGGTGLKEFILRSSISLCWYRNRGPYPIYPSDGCMISSSEMMASALQKEVKYPTFASKAAAYNMVSSVPRKVAIFFPALCGYPVCTDKSDILIHIPDDIDFCASITLGWLERPKYLLRRNQYPLPFTTISAPCGDSIDPSFLCPEVVILQFGCYSCTNFSFIDIVMADKNRKLAPTGTACITVSRNANG